MQIVIDIPEVYYEALRKTNVIISGQRSGKTLMAVIFDAVANGKPLKTGHWIEHPHEAGENWEYSRYECSECSALGDYYTDFCPNCGAKMAESEGEE